MADPSIERFRRVVSAASAYLDERRQEVNDLNVFPVADGDTGDNMALTLRAVADELDRLDGQMVDEIGRTELVDALARAALMGARGNSGVILSQIVRGAAEELASRPGELVDPVLVAAAMARAADAAYESVRDPAEGTMLTVFREMAHSVAKKLAHMENTRLDGDTSYEEQDRMLADLLEEVVRDGEAAVERTPEQLEVLRESGVVDAGAYGLVVIMAGIVAGLRGDIEAPEVAHHAPGGRHPPAPRRQPLPLLHQLHRHRQRAGRHGASCRGWRSSATPCWWSATRRRIKVHVHTDEPEAAMALFEGGARSPSSTSPTCASRWPSAPRGCRPAAAGWSPWRPARACGSSTRSSAPSSSTAARRSTPRSTTCWPRSTRSRAEEVVVLPNNPNVLMAAERAAELSDKQTTVVPAPPSRPAWWRWSRSTPRLSGEENAERLGAAARRGQGRLCRPRGPRRRPGALRHRRRGRLRGRRDRRLG